MKKAHAAHDKVLFVRLTIAEHAELTAAAEAAHIPLSTYVRHLLFGRKGHR